MFVDELKDMINKDIVVIMTDGRGFRGKLRKVDNETIVLQEVYETSNQDVDERGCMFWRKVLHSKLIIHVPLVMRIWPWDAPSLSAQATKKTAVKTVKD